jgi:hypothetical protein
MPSRVSELTAEIERLRKLTIRQRATINRLRDENEALRHDLERSMAREIDLLNAQRG